MTHCLRAMIKPTASLSVTLKLFSVELPQGMSLIPLTHALDRNMHLIGDDLMSRPFVSIETDYFGGVGEQWASYISDDKKTNGQSINDALRALGVVADEDKDEFDSIELYRFRETETALSD